MILPLPLYSDHELKERTESRDCEDGRDELHPTMHLRIKVSTREKTEKKVGVEVSVL